MDGTKVCQIKMTNNHSSHITAILFIKINSLGEGGKRNQS